jgi:hypothetical protein
MPLKQNNPTTSVFIPGPASEPSTKENNNTKIVYVMLRSEVMAPKTKIILAGTFEVLNSPFMPRSRR